jgi:hypothetical protein
MSIFWKYFRDTLAWPLIRSNGALAALAEGGAKNLDDARTDILWLRNQFNPTTCETQYIDHYGAARGISRNIYETDEQWKSRVVSAYEYQVKSGKVAGMSEILAMFGFTVTDVINCHNEDLERWAEFRVKIDVPEGGYQPVDYRYLSWLINDIKPARSVLASIKLPDLQKTDPIYWGCALILQPLITISEFTE